MSSIYKYMTFLQFLDLIESRRLYLSSVGLWDDKYEAFAARQFFMPLEMQRSVHPDFLNGARETSLGTLYAQSWTCTDESDALWRIYSNGTGVRIQTTVQLVETAIANTLAGRLEAGCEIKELSHFQVQYRDDLSYQEEEFQSGNTYSVSAKKALGDKRRAFEHEREYRFCARIQKPINGPATSDPKEMRKMLVASIPTTPTVYYEFVPDNLIDVRLDPRAPKYINETFITYCQNRKFTDLNIEFQQSKLYAL